MKGGGAHVDVDERYFRTHRKGDVTHGAGFELSVSHIELAGTFAMTPHVPPAELEFIHGKSLTSIQIHKRLEAQRAKKNIAAPHLTTAVSSQCSDSALTVPPQCPHSALMRKPKRNYESCRN